jgi:hypothetical protein
MAEPAEAVAQQTLDSKLDRIFGGVKEAPQQAQPEAVETQSETQESPETPVETTSEEGAPQETSEPNEEVIEVEFNGNKYQVPPELKDVLMKSSDYTQKTQSLAQQKREFEAQAAQLALQREEIAFQQSTAQEVDTLKMLEQYIPYVKANTNWDSLTTDQFVRKQKEIQDLTDQYTNLSSLLNQKHKAFKEKVDGERKNLKKQATEALSKAIPGFTDKVQGEIESYVKGLGYPDVAIPHMNTLDYQIAWKAAQYDKLKTSTASAVKKAADTPMIKATSRKEMPSKVKEMLNTRKVLSRAKQGSDEQKVALDRRLSQIFGGN